MSLFRLLLSWPSFVHFSYWLLCSFGFVSVAPYGDSMLFPLLYKSQMVDGIFRCTAAAEAVIFDNQLTCAIAFEFNVFTFTLALILKARVRQRGAVFWVLLRNFSVYLFSVYKMF